MQKIFRLDDIEYFWTGSGWVYADSLLAVPDVLGQALDHHFGHIVGQARPMARPSDSEPRWHAFDEGEIYYREDVVTAVEGWLSETGPEKMESKQANLDIIAGGPERIRFEPQGEGEGWGRSPGNAACWVDVETGERLR